MPAIETDDAIEEVTANESNFTEEILQNLEDFAQEAQPINITRIRRTCKILFIFKFNYD